MSVNTNICIKKEESFKNTWSASCLLHYSWLLGCKWIKTKIWTFFPSLIIIKPHYQHTAAFILLEYVSCKNIHVDSQKASSIKWFHTFLSFFCRWPFFCSTKLMVSQMREIFLWEKPNFKNCCLVSVGLYWKRSRSTYTQTNYNRASMHNYGGYNTIFLCKYNVKRQTENTIMCHRRLTGAWINGTLKSWFYIHKLSM